MQDRHKWFSALLLTSCWLSQVAAQDVVRRPQFPNDLSGPSRALINDVDQTLGIAVSAHDKWIGVMCRPVSDSLRAHVQLPDDAGLLVEEVIPESPAAEAGLQKHDILLSANHAPLATIVDLIKSVGNSGDEVLTLEWLRNGEVIEGDVVPAERPTAHAMAIRPGQGARPMINSLRAWADQLEGQGVQEPGAIKLRVFGDGFGLSGQEFPTNLRVEIHKSGNSPAVIKVQQGDSTWEVSEDQLDQLPEELQPHVRGMLGGRRGIDGPIRLDVDGVFEPMPMPFEDLHESMRRMHERMDRVFDELEELQELQAAPQADEDDTIDA